MSNVYQRAILKKHPGMTLLSSLVFLGIFLLLTTGLLSTVILEMKVSQQSIAQGQAFAAAEAGIEYYRWHLAHAPDDLTDGKEGPGPFLHDYRDPQGDQIGSFELEITPRDTCNGQIRILSRGWSASDPTRKRTVAITYGAPALTKYSFLTNANIWFGGNDELKGPVHGNGGIRMDVDTSGRITSAKETYICGREHDCNPPTTKPGVWGTGSGGAKGLWDFPTALLNFSTISLNVTEVRAQARLANTAFGPSQAFGYHARLNSNGTVDVFRVDEIKPKVWGYDGRTGWVEVAESIKRETLIRTMTIPEADACGTTSLLFFEDALWVDGETKRPVTLVAGRIEGEDASIIINGNLTTPASGQQGKLGSVGLVAQKDILIPLESPNALELHAALFAQKGHVFRNYYCSDERLNRWYGYKCKSNYGPWILRDTVNLKGTVITNQIAAWTWVNSYGQVVSGYRGGENTYDTRLIFSPPPFFPRYGENRILTWEEVTE